MIAIFCTCFIILLFSVLFARIISNGVRELAGSKVVIAAVTARQAINIFIALAAVSGLGALVTGLGLLLS